MTVKRRSTGGGLYRSRNGILLGVCRGVADYFEIGAIWLRLALIGIVILTGFWPALIGYVAAALILRPQPVIPLRSEASEDFYHSYVDDRRTAVRRLKRTYDDLQRRIQRIEDIVTSRDYQWRQRMEE